MQILLNLLIYKIKYKIYVLLFVNVWSFKIDQSLALFKYLLKFTIIFALYTV
jgi:hypothetical protein